MSQGRAANYDLPFFRNRNRGPSYAGAPHILVTNFIYEVPGLGKRLNLRPLGWVTDNWTMSGIYQWQSHRRHRSAGRSRLPAPAANNPAPNFTGSAEGARMSVIRQPDDFERSGDLHEHLQLAGIPGRRCLAAWNGRRWTASAMRGADPPSAIPTDWMNNWDMTFAKSFRAGERREFTFRAEMYNIFNHTQFSSINSTIQFDLASYQNWTQGKGQLVQSNTQLGRYTGTQSPRRMAMSLRFQF